MVDDDAVAVDSQPVRVDDRAAIGGDDRHVGSDREVEAEVRLLVDVLAVVDVGAGIREGRLDL